jgi:leucyl-tRNA synthetase
MNSDDERPVYDPAAIEKKWQAAWRDQKTNEIDITRREESILRAHDVSLSFS